jgi:hypothetical protein
MGVRCGALELIRDLFGEYCALMFYLVEL